jgi:hypothetical protein
MDRSNGSGLFFMIFFLLGNLTLNDKGGELMELDKQKSKSLERLTVLINVYVDVNKHLKGIYPTLEESAELKISYDVFCESVVNAIMEEGKYLAKIKEA